MFYFLLVAINDKNSKYQWIERLCFGQERWEGMKKLGIMGRRDVLGKNKSWCFILVSMKCTFAFWDGLECSVAFWESMKCTVAFWDGLQGQ